MAVAEDLHLDFLIPEYAKAYPTTDVTASDELRLFFCSIYFSIFLCVLQVVASKKSSKWLVLIRKFD